jgi:dTDP-4-dehydrorhamnose 3,5-epimerase
MKFTPTQLKGAYVVEPVLLSDDRGFFARTWCRREFRDRGLNPDMVQCNVSFNKIKGTLRGMHHQVAPHEEAKLVRCTTGAIYDVILDLRPDSRTYKAWAAFKLSADNRKMIYIPEGFSHGFMTLEDNTEIFYQMAAYYTPECNTGVRWNDPAFNISWPAKPVVISEKDSNYPDYSARDHLFREISADPPRTL